MFVSTLVLCYSIATITSGVAARMNSATTPKHIVLISLDTLRGDCVAADGTKGHYLPSDIKNSIIFNRTFLDELAGKSMHYRRCFSAAPYTTASHASVFTGMFPLHHGLYEYYNASVGSKTIFEQAKDLNRHVVFKTDFPVILGKTLGFTRGVDDYVVEDDKRCLELLESHKNDQTLDFVHFGGIHYPYGFHTEKISGAVYPQKVASLEHELGIVAAVLPADQMDETFRDNADKDLLYRYKNIIETLYAQKNYIRLTELYVEGISYFVEHRFKPFFEKLLSIYDINETKIYIFGDHGEEWSPSSEGHYKTLSRGVLNVPLLVYGSGVDKGQIDSHVRTVDIGASVFADLGATNQELDGLTLPTVQTNHLATDYRIAVAQTWLGIGKNVLKKHIDDAQKLGRVEKDIATLKRGETVITADHQLLRLYNKDGQKTFDALLDLESGIETSNESEQRKIEAWLLAYNLSRNSEAGPTISIDDDMKELLRLQGYNV